MNIKVFQIYFDDSQKVKLNPRSIPYLNDNLTPLFENQVILDLQPQIEGSDYFGVLSHKFEQKNEINIPFELIEKGEYDIYCIGKNSIFNHNVLQFSTDTHGSKWRFLFFSMVSEVLFNNDSTLTLAVLESINKGIYQNAVICKSDIYNLYIESTLKPCSEWLENNTSLKSLLYSKCDYNGNLNPEQLISKFGVPHYTFHTFLLERLWSLFLQANKLNDISVYYSTDFR
jgi:hypothetical protein